jgi:hypothetical protein
MSIGTQLGQPASPVRNGYLGSGNRTPAPR